MVAVTELKAWEEFLRFQAEAPPMQYIYGIRHPTEAGQCCTLHFHQALEVVYHRSGRGISRLGKRESLSFLEGSVMMYAPLQKHDQYMEKKGEDLCVHVAVPKPFKDKLQGCLCVDSIERLHLEEEIELLAKGYSEVGSVEQKILNYRATSLVLALIQAGCSSGVQEEMNTADGHVLRAERYIREHYLSIRSVQEIAAHVGISHDYLRHVFHDKNGKSLVRYLAEIRIARAKLLLVHSKLSLKQVASMSGFKDEYYFSAVFRKIVRMAPGSYRRAQ